MSASDVRGAAATAAGERRQEAKRNFMVLRRSRASVKPEKLICGRSVTELETVKGHPHWDEKKHK